MIIHLDGDGFFAACELLRRRDLKDRPVVVGQERGIATAMNPQAKKIGVKRGDPVFLIKKTYGDTVAIIPSHFDLYHHVSAQTYAVLQQFGYPIDPYGIDENFLEIDIEDPLEQLKLAKKVQKALLDTVGVSYSIGVARTKAIAKLCSKYRKPFGCTVVAPHREEAFLSKIEIENVWGIGWALGPKMRKQGIDTALHLRNMSDRDAKPFGKFFLELRDELQGKTRMSFNMTRQAQKSMEATRMLDHPSNERSFVLSELSRNVEVTSSRLFHDGLVASHIRIFLKSKEYGRHYISSELENPTNNPRHLLKTALALGEAIWDPTITYKATGVCVSGCRPQNALQDDLFGIQGTLVQESESLQKALETIKGAYGGSSIQFGSSLQSQKTRLKYRSNRDREDEYIYGLPLPYLGVVA
jgi:DNA polymerase-4/DNA polymerase V